MPIATPEIYNEMLDKAKSGRVRLPGDQRHEHRDAQRGTARVRRGRERRHRPGLHRRCGVPVRHRGEGHGDGLGRARRVRARRRRRSTRQHRAAHRPLPEGQARQVRPPADRRSARSASTAARTRCSSRTCGTGRRSSWRRTSRSRPSCSTRRSRRRSSSRSRSASSAARRTASPTTSTTSSTPPPATTSAPSRSLGGGEKGRYLLAATFGNVHGVYKPGNVKLRPEILKQGQEVAREKLGLGSRRQAVRPGVPRRFGLADRGDPRGAGLRRGEDERRHRHAVRVHPPDRRAHVHELRRRAEDRRRGRQQEGLRPALVPQGRRGRAWPRASSRPARTCARRAPRSGSEHRAAPPDRRSERHFRCS